MSNRLLSILLVSFGIFQHQLCNGETGPVQVILVEESSQRNEHNRSNEESCTAYYYNDSQLLVINVMDLMDVTVLIFDEGQSCIFSSQPLLASFRIPFELPNRQCQYYIEIHSAETIYTGSFYAI